MFCKINIHVYANYTKLVFASIQITGGGELGKEKKSFPYIPL